MGETPDTEHREHFTRSNLAFKQYAKVFLIGTDPWFQHQIQSLQFGLLAGFVMCNRTGRLSSPIA